MNYCFRGNVEFKKILWESPLFFLRCVKASIEWYLKKDVSVIILVLLMMLMTKLMWRKFLCDSRELRSINLALGWFSSLYEQSEIKLMIDEREWRPAMRRCESWSRVPQHFHPLHSSQVTLLLLGRMTHHRHKMYSIQLTQLKRTCGFSSYVLD